MSTNEFNDLDPTWSEFTTSLTDCLADLASGESVVVVRLDDPDRHPLVTFRSTSAHRVRATVAVGPIGQATTGAGGQDGEVGEIGETLTSLGWKFLPTKGEYIAEVGRKSAGRVVETVELTLQQVWGIAEPSLLDVIDPAAPAPAPAPAESPSPSSWSVECTNAIPPVAPRDHEHLLALAHATLSSVTDTRLTIDEGVLTLPAAGGSATRVSVADRGLRLRFTVPISDQLPDPAALGALLVDHCAQWPEIAILAGEEGVRAERSIDCSVFHPIMLERMLPDWRSFVADTVPRHVAQLNPAGAVSHSPGLTIPPALHALLSEHTEDQPLTAERIVERSNGRLSRLHGHLHACREAAAGWRSAAVALRESGADDDADQLAEMQHEFDGFALLIEAAIALVEG